MRIQQLNGIGMTSQRTRDRMIRRLQAQGITDTAVLDQMQHTPRHLFVEEALAHRVYEDASLPIGYGQTLSQPYIVARMTSILVNYPNIQKVLEIGTGSGYQTAVLAGLFAQVYSIERIVQHHHQAKRRLQALSLRNTHLKHGDGFVGWPDQAPFDAIVITAAPQQIPPLLLAQLRSDQGVLIAPVGSEQQQLRVVEKQDHSLRTQMIEPVNFVPLIPGLRG